MKKFITLRLEKELLGEVNKRVKSGRYSTRTEYIQDLIRQDIEGRNLQGKILSELRKLKELVR